MTKAKITKIIGLALTTIAFVFVSGAFMELSAQRRDPFKKNPVYKKKKTGPRGKSSGSKKGKKVKKGKYIVSPPPLQARLNFFYQIRAEAAENNKQLPKATSILLLDEMEVSGIIKTPRGYAAMVKVAPISLSFTIYPGERFFDGQLVAIEENGLVFRKVTKWSTGKFVSSVENKSLRQYSDQQTIQGTAPKGSQTASAEESKKPKAGDTKAPGVIVSPLDEMNQKANEEPKDSAKNNSKGKKVISKKKKRS